MSNEGTSTEVEDADQLIDLIRDTVDQLNILGDRLEGYATRKSKKIGDLPDG